MLRSACWAATALVAVGSLSACDRGARETLTAQLGAANDEVLACSKGVTKQQEEIAKLKRQLAEAMADPARIVLTDPDIIELVAKVKKARAAGSAASGSQAKGDGVQLGKGDLNPRDASRIVLQGAGAMQVCYERALKRNSALQFQTGIGLTLGLTVKPTGAVHEVSVIPGIDRDMVQCIKSAASHWKFPAFAGQPVSIEQRVSLTPKT